MADEKAWTAELNALEETLKQCLESRAKPCVNEMVTLKRAFVAFDADNSGQVSYKEFVRALEKFGFTASPSVRGLFDRYARVDGDNDNLSYTEFSAGLFGDEKPPVHPKPGPGEWLLEDALIMRTTPANKWQGSTGELVASPTRAVRQLSIANEKHRGQPPWKWSQGADGQWTHE